MRGPLKAVVYGLLFLSGVTCTEAPTAPGSRGGGGVGGRTALSIVPEFSIAAKAALKTLNDFGISIDNVHIHIDHPPAAAFDTVVVFPVGADSLILELPIVLNSESEQLNVEVELREGSTVLFSGTQTITAMVGQTTSSPPPVPIAYVGPGATAVKLTIAPRDTTITILGGAAYHFSAIDASGNNVIGSAVDWSLGDGTLGAITASGVLTPSGKAGKTFVFGQMANGLRDSTTITIATLPTKVVTVSGAGQTGAAGTALAQPFVAQVQAADGTPVPGVLVTFSTTSSGASVSPTSAVSDDAGHAQTTMTLGKTVGAESFAAASAGLTGTSVSETATAATATQLAKISGDGQADSIGRALAQPFVVKVTDAFGNAASGVTVNWARVAGVGSLSATTSVSDTAGLASVNYTLGTTARTDSISASLAGVPTATVQFTVRSLPKGPSAIAKVSGDAQTGVVGSTLANPLVVKVTDNAGNAVAGVQVTWVASAGGGILAPHLGTTDSTGQTSTVFILPNSAGANQITATLVATGATVSFTETSTAGVAAIMTKQAGGAQPGSANTAVPVMPAVLVTDANNNPASGVQVIFTIANGGGTVSGGTQTTNASGIATVGGWTLGASGAQSLKATAGALAVTFSASIGGGPATTIAATSTTAIVDTAGRALPTPKLPTVVVTDGSGNPVSGVTVTFTAFRGTISGGTVNTSPSGIAVLGGLTVFTDTTVIDTVFATVSGLAGSPVTFTVTAHPNVAAQLKFTVEPSDAFAGELISPAIRVSVFDAFGNRRTSAGDSETVTLGILHGPRGAELGGRSGPSDDTVKAHDGTARFDVSDDRDGTYKLRATSPGLASATSTTYTISHPHDHHDSDHHPEP